MVAGEDQNLDAGSLEGGQLFPQVSVAGGSAVEGQISAEDQQVGLDGQHLGHKGLGDLGEVGGGQPISLRCHLLEGSTPIGEPGREVVQVGSYQDGHGVLLAGAGRDLSLSGGQCQSGCQYQPTQGQRQEKPPAEGVPVVHGSRLFPAGDGLDGG